MKNRITSPVLKGMARAMCHDVGICKSHRAMYGNCICNHKRDTAAPGEGPLWTFGLPEARAVAGVPAEGIRLLQPAVLRRHLWWGG